MNNVIHSEARGEQDGFKIHFYALPEDGQYDGEDEHGNPDQQVIDRINDGTYLWFVAKITASKAGVELGTAYLGGCCYESYEQFFQPGDYYAQMVDEAITEARSTLAKLCMVSP